MEHLDEIEKATLRGLDGAVAKLKEEYSRPKDKILLTLRLGKFSLTLAARQKAKTDWEIIMDAKEE